MSKKKKSSSGAGSGTDLLDNEKAKNKVEPPSKYQVVFHNDDFTPMGLVSAILIHKKGKGIAGGPYSKEIAETKALQATDIVRSLGFPLLAKEEKID